MEEALPVEVEDAYPVPYRGRELQGLFQYQRTDEGEDRFIVEPRLEYGFAPNWQARVAVPFEFRPERDDGLDDIGLELFYNFNSETLSLPAFAVSLGADFPTGADSSGVDPDIEFIATKTVGTGVNLDRLHLNVSYGFNSARRSDERRDRVTVATGYSRRLNAESVLVSDFVYEQEKEKDQDVFLLELGIRYQQTPRNVLTVGGGFGLGQESPDVQITLGFQQSF